MDTRIRNTESHEFNQDDIEELSATWAKNISDPPPQSGQFVRWLRTYGKRVTANAVNACIRKYNHMHRIGTPMDYDHTLRYTSACARNATVEAETFRAPAAWLRNSE